MTSLSSVCLSVRWSLTFLRRVFVFRGPRLFAWPPVLAPNLYLPALALYLYLPTLALAPSLYLPTLAPLYLPALAPNLCLPTMAPNFYLPALVYNFIISPGVEFYIYQPCLLNLCFYLRPWPTICITVVVIRSSGSCNSSSNLFGIDNTNICMPILVN